MGPEIEFTLDEDGFALVTGSDGYISPATAESAYGVVVTDTGDLDQAATDARRSAAGTGDD